jgi:hypothetical protein
VATRDGRKCEYPQMFRDAPARVAQASQAAWRGVDGICTLNAATWPLPGLHEAAASASIGAVCPARVARYKSQQSRRQRPRRVALHTGHVLVIWLVRHGSSRDGEQESQLRVPPCEAAAGTQESNKMARAWQIKQRRSREVLARRRRGVTRWQLHGRGYSCTPSPTRRLGRKS